MFTTRSALVMNGKLLFADFGASASDANSGV